MDERSALAATWLEAFETARPPAPSWSDVDRLWADRVALEAAGMGGSLESFVGERARHAMQRLAGREAIVSRGLLMPSRGLRWTALVVVVAFLLGVLADALGGARRINLLAPPLWGVLVWNAFVYLALVAWPLLRVARRGRAGRGPWVRVLAGLVGGSLRTPLLAAGASSTALRTFAGLWVERGRTLAVWRAETLLHLGAAALALGLVAGLYVRGLVFDYRATWESTFLTPDAAHAIVSTLLAPAAMLSGIGLPDVAAFAAMRSAEGQPLAGAPAAPWIHLLALTLVIAVVLPRLVLALAMQALVRWRAQRVRLPLEQPYYQRLARLQRGASAHLAVFPYGAVLSPQAALGLRTLLAESFGPRVTLDLAPTVAFGQEDEAPLAVPAGTTHAIALFDLAATPESDNQGRFLRRLAGILPAGAALAVLLDESSFARRFGQLPGRIEQRREAWRGWGEAHGSKPVGVDLEGPAPAAVDASLQAAFAAPAPA
ncbi:MAG: DUF2868 domain-containing protein [Caldimonas sp.]